VPPELTIDPRLRALYLLAIAVGVFFLPSWWMVAIVAGAQVGLWLALGIGVGALLRQLRKLALFLAVIQVAYALVTVDPARDVWSTLAVFGLEVDLNQYGALVGLTMVLRVIAVVLASQVARAGDPRALAGGLGQLGVPRKAALSIDATLALLGSAQAPSRWRRWWRWRRRRWRRRQRRPRQERSRLPRRPAPPGPRRRRRHRRALARHVARVETHVQRAAPTRAWPATSRSSPASR
jgi:hypothetical protein